MKKSILLYILFLIHHLSFSQFAFEHPVKWKFHSEDQGKGVYELFFNGTIKEPWHVYAIKLEKEGPIPTSVNYELTNEFRTEGELIELVKPELKYDPGFQFNIGMYMKNVGLKQKIQLTSESEVIIKGYIEYQCCDDETCLPPYQQEFSFKLPGVPASEKINAEKVVPGTEKEDQKLSLVSKAESLQNEINAGERIPAEEDSDITQEKVTAGQITIGTQKGSLFLFFLIAFLAGLAAILTPCVFPMIPMTVSFFMQGSSNRGMAILKGLVFGSSIILIYTGLGVIVGITGMGADTGTVISTHWIPNLIFFLLFMVFAASFLGMFELIIPSGLINKADRQADKGGIAGAFFMGITTVLVSFSCTGPIVGSLLIESTGGLAIKPILGMFFFSLAFAIPFTLLAIFPSVMKNMPKSGGWLNSVKVVLGFIVLAFGLKFLSAIDQSYHLNILSREIYLAIWFVLSILLGLYLLGKLKFAHDSDLPYVSVPRFVLALISFTFAVYLFTGILGADLKSIAALIPPKSADSFNFPSRGTTITTSDQSDTYCGPGKYNERFHLPHGLKGYFTWEDGLNCAKEKNKPVFLDFTGHSCSNCKQMENLVWPDPAVLKLLKEEYVVVSLYTDDKTRVADEDIIIRADGRELRTIGDINKQLEIDKFNTIATPLYVLLDPDGNLLAPPKGKDLNVQNFVEFLKEGLHIFNFEPTLKSLNHNSQWLPPPAP